MPANAFHTTSEQQAPFQYRGLQFWRNISSHYKLLQMLSFGLILNFLITVTNPTSLRSSLILFVILTVFFLSQTEGMKFCRLFMRFQKCLLTKVCFTNLIQGKKLLKPTMRVKLKIVIRKYL